MSKTWLCGEPRGNPVRIDALVVAARGDAGDTGSEPVRGPVRTKRAILTPSAMCPLVEARQTFPATDPSEAREGDWLLQSSSTLVDRIRSIIQRPHPRALLPSSSYGIRRPPTMVA